jgi:hypothetical protein
MMRKIANDLLERLRSMLKMKFKSTAISNLMVIDYSPKLVTLERNVAMLKEDFETRRSFAFMPSKK